MVIHLVRSSSDNLAAMLSIYPDAQSQFAALKLENNAHESVLHILSKQGWRTFITALKFVPKNDRFSTLFRKNPQTNVMEYDFTPSWSNEIVELLDDNEKVEFGKIVSPDKTEKKQQPTVWGSVSNFFASMMRRQEPAEVINNMPLQRYSM